MRRNVLTLFWALALPVSLLLNGCEKEYTVRHGDLAIHFNGKTHTCVEGFEPEMRPSAYLVTANRVLEDFDLAEFSSGEVADGLGQGTQFVVRGLFEEDELAVEKVLTIRAYNEYPEILIFNTMYINRGSRIADVTSWTAGHHHIERLAGAGNDDAGPGNEPHFWSFQGSSTGARADWILPLSPGFSQENYLGMNNSDYGGGIPIADVWRKDAGLAAGHLEMVPRLVSIPVTYGRYDDHASIRVRKNFQEPLEFGPGDTLYTYETFLACHQGDCFRTMRQYADIMKKKGLRFVEPEDAAFEPVWCAWGYERDFTVDEIIGTLPKVKELGIKWAVVDDGFQKAEGDWDVNREKFPGGTRDMVRLVDAIHGHGLKAKLWYAPLAVDPGSELFTQHPDMILYDQDWAPRYITWWDSYYMSPVYEKTIQHTREVIHMFMETWGFDGLKLDGQHMNGVPPDHHPDHGLDYPEEAVEKLPDFFHMVYETAREIKPAAVVENCPCGTCMSFYNMATTNQTVSSDPLSSWQIRLKGKVYKALIGDIAYYGDHVELSDNKSDFASSFGVGAVLGTKFTWPADNPTASDTYLLTPEKEEQWRKWFSLYNEMMLSRGEYLGSLYDIGFDRPETHVIEKDGILHYAFYSDSWEGSVEFRGLDSEKEYLVSDYVNGKELGAISGDNPVMDISFSQSLLVKLTPKLTPKQDSL